MRTALIRVGVAVASLVGWLGLMTATVVASFHQGWGLLVATVLIMVTMAYVVVIPFVFVALGEARDPGTGGTILVPISAISSFAVAILGLVTAVGFDRWYLNHHGVDTAARVVEAHCDGPVTPTGECEQDLRVVAANGVDLGWVGCNGTGFWRVDDSLQVRSDPRGLVPPAVSNCPSEGFLDTVIPLTGILVVVTVTTAAADTAFRRRREPGPDRRDPVDTPGPPPRPVDAPGWRPPKR